MAAPVFTGWMPFLPPNQRYQSTEGSLCMCNFSWKVTLVNIIITISLIAVIRICCCALSSCNGMYCRCVIQTLQILSGRKLFVCLTTSKFQASMALVSFQLAEFCICASFAQFCNLHVCMSVILVITMVVKAGQWICLLLCRFSVICYHPCS